MTNPLTVAQPERNEIGRVSTEAGVLVTSGPTRSTPALISEPSQR